MATAQSMLRFAYSTLDRGTTPDLAAVTAEIREGGMDVVELANIATADGFLDLEANRLRHAVTVDEQISGTAVPYQDAMLERVPHDP
jgi:hypothetical protein